jgi:GNAT superfamily N-acetyltransferase
VTADGELVRAIERNEADAWSACVLGLAGLDGNPLRAEVVVAAGVRVPIVAGLDDPFFNNVVGLGVDAPATADDLREIASAYEGRSQTRWAVVVAPPAAEAGLDALLLGHGLEHGSDFAKFVRSTERPPVVASELRVERIDADDADIFAAINVAAWELPAAAAGWFTGCVGRAGWLHYLCYDGSDPIATAAMYVKDGLAWTSWAATRPDGRGRGAQSALIAFRIRDAADLGCSHIHTETYDEQADNPSQSYRNLTRAGFELAYWRPNYYYDGSRVG